MASLTTSMLRMGSGRGVGAAGLLDLSLLLEVAEHPVQVVRLNAHLPGDLRGADAGVLPDDPDRLLGAGSAAPPAAPAGRARGRPARATRAPAALAAVGEVRQRSLELREL